ncbi:MAG: translation initiation factor [Chthoniobacterales bacterium]|nr:translation initiation factor [Chthoniobacterales bacterium]
MAREKRQRISTESAPALQTSPFASLEIQGRESLTGDTGVAPVMEQSASPRMERLLLRRSTARRSGKTVLVLEGFSPAWTDGKLRGLLHELKAALGCGGKLEGRTMEIQGEQAARLEPMLTTRGFSVKRGW